MCVWKVFFDFQFKIEIKIEKTLNFDFCPNIECWILTPKPNVRLQFLDWKTNFEITNFYFLFIFKWILHEQKSIIYVIIVSKIEYVAFLNDNFNFKIFWSLNLILFFNVNTLTVDASIPVVIRRIYRYQFKRIYLKNQKCFALLLLRFLNLHQILNIWRKKMSLIVCVFKYFWNYWLQKMWLLKCIKDPVSENPLAVNVLTSPRNYWNLQKSIFILLFHHSEPNWVRKNCFSQI